MIGNIRNTNSGVSRRSTALVTGSENNPQGYSNKGDQATKQLFSGLYKFRTENAEAKKSQNKPDQQLITAAQQGDSVALGQLLRTLDPTLDAAIKGIGSDARYKTRARLMAIDAIKNYDSSRGTELSTHVYNRLQGLRRIVADRGNFIHVPEKSALEKRQLEAIKQDYLLENGVEPSLGELADRSGMSLRKVGRLMSIYGTTATGATRGEHGDSLEAKPRTATELYNDAFYLELPEIDKKIYEWSTGYRGAPKLDRATMAKRLKISEAAISQHAQKIDRRAADFNRIVTDSIYGDTAYGETN